MENNLDLYNSWRAVPEDAQKTIQGGNLNGKTDINPMWRIKTLTEKFGPIGFGWYTKITEHWCDQQVIDGKTEVVAWVRVELYVNMDGKWSMPIEGVGGSKYAGKGRGAELNDEAFKMAETDAVSVACKKLGIGADIYWSGDNTKYTQGGSGAGTSQKAASSTQKVSKCRELTMSDQDKPLRDVLANWAAEGFSREGCEKTMTQAYKVTIPVAIWENVLAQL